MIYTRDVKSFYSQAVMWNRPGSASLLLVARSSHSLMVNSMHNTQRKERQPAPASRALMQQVIYVFLPGPGHPRAQARQRTPLLLALCLLCLLILGTTQPDAEPLIFSKWSSALAASHTAAITVQPVGHAGSRASTDHVLAGPPSISAQQIDAVLASYGSPATGTGAAFYQLGLAYGIDPAYALAFFIHESGAGTNAAWAGLKPGGATTHNIGNIICAGYPTCYGRFRDYRSWEDGIRDWYRLMRVEYIEGRGLRTVGEMLPIYAPSSDNNNPAGYTAAVEQMVDGWRAP
jgi:hypothetical protein